MLALLIFIAMASPALSASQFGLEVNGTHSSGCLIVKNATGKAAACGVRYLDLVCSINDEAPSAKEAPSLPDSTPCSHLVIRRHSIPCHLLIRNFPAGNGVYDVGLRLKAQTSTLESDPSAITAHYIVEASLSSERAVGPGDWIRTVGALSLSNTSPEQVSSAMSGARASVVEVCWWSGDVRLVDVSSDTVEGDALMSSILLILSAAAVLIGSLWALKQTPKGGERNAKREGHGGCPNAVVERRRRDPQLIGDLVARPAFLHAFQAAVKQLQAVLDRKSTRLNSSHLA